MSWSSVTEAEIRQGISAWDAGYTKMKSHRAKPHSRDVSEWASRGELVKEMPTLRPEGQEGASQTMAQKRKFQAEKGQGSLDRLWKESFAFL